MGKKSSRAHNYLSDFEYRYPFCLFNLFDMDLFPCCRDAREEAEAKTWERRKQPEPPRPEVKRRRRRDLIPIAA